MSESETPVLPPHEHLHEHAEPSQKPIFLISYPKIIFLYPTFFAALLAGMLMLGFGINGDAEANRPAELTTLAFLALFSMNLVVLAFDFPRTTSLTLFFFVGMVLMGLFLLFHFNPHFLPVVGRFIASLRPIANAQFYFLFAGILFCFYLMVAVSVRFDYWEVRPNELLNHHGYLSDLKRHPAPNIRIDKEINDVFEYLLLGSGRLIIHPNLEPRAIVLENVLFIDKKEEALTKMLGSLQVQITSNNT
jgi:hypothetical protein